VSSFRDVYIISSPPLQSRRSPVAGERIAGGPVSHHDNFLYVLSLHNSAASRTRPRHLYYTPSYYKEIERVLSQLLQMPQEFNTGG
jgi:hypothetical protein